MIIIIIFTDEDLEKIKVRDPETFKKLYEEYGKKVYNFLLIKTNGDEIMADELASQTFFSVLESAPKLKKIQGIQTWIFRIASRRFCDSLRKKYREKEYIEKNNEEVISQDNQIEDLMLKEKVLMLNLALDNLDENYKKALQLKYNENKSQKEIAKILDRSISAVESLLFKARKKLKVELSKIAKDI
jgi:RNA polymerase sigma-70 factor (ECF subfamily)